MYDGERGIALEPMKGNQASSQVDLGYTELFHIPSMASVSFWSCEGVHGDSVEFRQTNQGSLCV